MSLNPIVERMLRAMDGGSPDTAQMRGQANAAPVFQPPSWLPGAAQSPVPGGGAFPGNAFAQRAQAWSNAAKGGNAAMAGAGYNSPYAQNARAYAMAAARGTNAAIFGTGGGGSSSSNSGLQNMARFKASSYGWTGAQWDALKRLVQKESSWRPNAQNPTSTAFGLFQFLNGTWGPYGKKTSDPGRQTDYGLRYIKDRYGDPLSALRFHLKNNWY